MSRLHYITRPAREGKGGVPKGAIPLPKGEVLHWAGMSMMEFHHGTGVDSGKAPGWFII
jgi:hypothetical protein